MKQTNDYLTKCPCGRTTSKAYARSHEGRCKPCATGFVMAGIAEIDSHIAQDVTGERRAPDPPPL